MIDKFKKFVNKHKQEFDKAEPSQDLWKKIDAKMEVKNTSWISSKWLSKFKYFGLSASVLMIAVYFISQKLNNSSSNELAQNAKDSALNTSGEWVKANQNKSEISNAGNRIENSDNKKSQSKNSLSGTSINSEKSTDLVQLAIENAKRDSLNRNSDESVVSEHSKVKAEPHSLSKEEESLIVTNEKKNTNLIKNNKKKGILIPKDSEKLNSYSGTLYDNSSLCSVLQAYKFPGKVNLDGSTNYTGHRTMKTISCSRLQGMTNIKAVWLKGRTDKKITLSIKDGFKNIVLVKSDGSRISPEAISHYYKGLGVISGYTGKYFDIIFKDKVELILFFKDVEEGDKISVDGIIEAVVSKP